MRTLVVLTGARGAGKTTMSRYLQSLNLAQQLKPFTTRPPRGEDDNEYYFLDHPPAEVDTAWSVTVGAHTYGMMISELQRIPVGNVAVTVFEPNQLMQLDRFASRSPHYKVIKVGLDTISSVVEQQERVEGDGTRANTQEEINTVRAILGKLDVTMSGDELTIKSALVSICQIFGSGGGVLTRNHIKPLMLSGSLLRGYQRDNIKFASYDLRVGQEAWCQGAFINLTDDSPFLKIPPYSYAIVKAVEVACFPTFLTGSFDIRVSYFFSGLILSNGPQIDPGYEGDFFCMLFNGSSDEFRVRMGDHFASLEFLTATSVGERYTDVYSLSDRLNKHMSTAAATGSGGMLTERIRGEFRSEIDSAVTRIKGDIPRDYNSIIVGVTAVAVGIALAAGGWAASAAISANTAAEAARAAAVDAAESIKGLEQEAGATSSPTAEPSEEVVVPQPDLPIEPPVSPESTVPETQPLRTEEDSDL